MKNQEKIMPTSDFEFLQKYIDTHDWIFAKTDVENPHEYTLRRNSIDAEFVKFVVLIREYGFTLPYGRYNYTCFTVGDYFYWTMGCPLHNDAKTGTILINRKRCDLSNEYQEYIISRPKISSRLAS